MDDRKYMQEALRLAQKGCGFVNPNPMVGALIVKNNRIIGEGYHEKFGGLHAERNALASCDESPKGATMYVTLEPCCHYGKTSPCTEAILHSGISKVVIGSKDPNPMVDGKGIKLLKEGGIEVVYGVLEKECRQLNEVFFHYVQTKRPFLVMKYAMTMDGKIAAYTGESKWITGEIARERVHQDRKQYSGVMVGVNTVLADDPLLTCRLEKGRNPVRIILDTSLRTPQNSNIVKTADSIPTMIATTCSNIEKHKPYTDAGCRLLTISQEDKYLNFKELVTRLGEEGMDSILLEGGGNLNWSALQSGFVNKVQAYISPKLFGGCNGKTPIGGIGIEHPEEAFLLTNSRITQLGEDFLIESEVKFKCLQE